MRAIASARRSAVGLAAACCGAVAVAANFGAHVADAGGAPVRDAVVYLLPAGGAKPPPAPPHAVIEQLDRDFIPFVTAIRAGTAVAFPNRDQVMHHVYSFSSAKTFQIKLYEGDPPKPIVFDKPGVVALGCNIHDWMQAYVVVVETPYFAVSDAQGNVRIADLPGGAYEARAWHPYAADEWRQAREVAASGETRVSITLPTRAPVRKPKPPLDLNKY